MGLKSILACAAYSEGAVVAEQLIDGFAELCQRAARIDVWVDLEPMPFFGCDDVAAAWAVVGQGGQCNSGILIDTWHFYEASHYTLEVLDDIPGQYFRTMQINDTPTL